VSIDEICSIKTVSFFLPRIIWGGVSMGQFAATETIIIELLLVVTVVALAVRRFSIPYTVALVVVGLLRSNW
jgi:hypothetical protein